jgi:hypothetical protein
MNGQHHRSAKTRAKTKAKTKPLIRKKQMQKQKP